MIQDFIAIALALRFFKPGGASVIPTPRLVRLLAWYIDTYHGVAEPFSKWEGTSAHQKNY